MIKAAMAPASAIQTTVSKSFHFIGDLNGFCPMALGLL